MLQVLVVEWLAPPFLPGKGAGGLGSDRGAALNFMPLMHSCLL